MTDVSTGSPDAGDNTGRSGLLCPFLEGEGGSGRAGNTWKGWDFEEIPGSRTTCVKVFLNIFRNWVIFSSVLSRSFSSRFSLCLPHGFIYFLYIFTLLCSRKRNF